MIEAWWKAHEFEYLVSAIVIGVLLVVAGVCGIVMVVRERRARARRIDEALECFRQALRDRKAE